MGKFKHNEVAKKAQRKLLEVLESEKGRNPMRFALNTRCLHEVDENLSKVQIAFENLLLEKALVRQYPLEAHALD